MSDDAPLLEDILAALEEVPVINPDAISKEDNMGGNVICARCWMKWISEDTDWRYQQVAVVTILKGEALCQSHFVQELGIRPGHAAPPKVV